MYFYKSIIKAAMIFNLFVMQYSHAESVGLVGLFKADNSVSHQTIVRNLEQQAIESNCILHREGKILVAEGDYDLDTVNNFIILECNNSAPHETKMDHPLMSVLAQPWLVQLKESTQNLVLLEGDFSFLNKQSINQSGKGRSYIIKISDYNNIDPRKRNSDLVALGQLVQTRTPSYTTEAFLRISDAYGITRPDEVAIIYYDTAKDGDTFREENADILKKIGAFNKDHLSKFNYLISDSNR